jgi:hypothetical protein
MFDVKLLELLVLVGALTAATSVSAQTRLSATGEAAAALGHGRGGEYRDRDIGGFQFAGSVRFRRSATISAFGEIAMESLGALPHDAICEFLPNGGCVPEYPAALLGQLDGAEFPLEHVGITLGVRPVLLARFRGDRLWVVPVSLGLRVR